MKYVLIGLSTRCLTGKHVHTSFIQTLVVLMAINYPANKGLQGNNQVHPRVCKKYTQMLLGIGIYSKSNARIIISS
jgi:hypothetical protein